MSRQKLNLRLGRARQKDRARERKHREFKAFIEGEKRRLRHKKEAMEREMATLASVRLWEAARERSINPVPWWRFW